MEPRNILTNSYIMPTIVKICLIHEYWYKTCYAIYVQSYLFTKFHDDISTFVFWQYLKCPSLNSYISTTKRNIHFLITYYDMKYLCLSVYQIFYRNNNILILNIFQCSRQNWCIWWYNICYTAWLWKVSTQKNK
jgi:hypothetical protein